MIDYLKRLLFSPEDALEVDEEKTQLHTESHSVRTLGLTEPITLGTTAEQHLNLLKAQGTTGKDKSKIIRAAITLALPTLISNPHMIDLLQPGVHVDHDILEEALSGRAPVPGRSDNGRG